jgi:lipocalin
MVRLIVALGIALAITVVNAQDSCKTVSTVENFDIEKYASKPWYIQQQAITTYSPLSQNYCTRAKYKVRKSATIPWGYTVNVNNYAEDSNGNTFGGPLCAYQTTGSKSKLAVAPCFLPKFAAGPYWIIAYDETEGYALVSGGQPTIQGKDGGCKTGTGTNKSGLWIFTRAQKRDDTLVTKVRSLAQAAGFDLSVLNDVVQEGCDQDLQSCKDQTEKFKVWFGGERDCNWVDQFRVIRCALYGDKCRETCGKC